VAAKKSAIFPALVPDVCEVAAKKSAIFPALIPDACEVTAKKSQIFSLSLHTHQVQRDFSCSGKIRDGS
jgi:hypothetical protein